MGLGGTPASSHIPAWTEQSRAGWLLLSRSLTRPICCAQIRGRKCSSESRSQKTHFLSHCVTTAPGRATQLAMRSEFNNFLRRHSERTSDLCISAPQTSHPSTESSGGPGLPRQATSRSLLIQGRGKVQCAVHCKRPVLFELTERPALEEGLPPTASDPSTTVSKCPLRPLALAPAVLPGFIMGRQRTAKQPESKDITLLRTTRR